MKLSIYFKKDPWLRRVHKDNASGRFALGYKPISPLQTQDDAFVQLTSSDFLNELSPAAHPINSRYLSTRPIWKKTGETQGGKDKWVIDGYDELESISLGWQQFICGNKVAHLTGSGGFQVCNETEDFELFEDLSSHMDEAGLHDAFAEAVYYCERAGDSGILFMQVGKEITWEVYSYEKGHTIYPQVDDKGRPVYYITYKKGDVEMCDVISCDSIQKWAKIKEDEEEKKDGNPTLLERLWSRFKYTKKKETTEDGYVLVSEQKSQCGNDICQFVYFRVPDVPWGPVQLTIEEHENAASYVANEVKDTAFPILVLKAEKTTSLPPTKMNGKAIGITGSADALAHSDVHFASPPDASNIATLHFKELNSNIMMGSQSVLISPDIMKQGADSSTSIKILFRPEIEWAKSRWIFYNKPVRYMVKVFTILSARADGKIDKYDNLRTSIWQSIWIPENEKEQNQIILDKVYARVMSRKAAMNELGSQYKGDYEQIEKEWVQELTNKAEIPAKAKAKFGDDSQTFGEDEEHGNPAKVDNRSKGKTIQE